MTKSEDIYWHKKHILWNILCLPTIIIPNIYLLMNWNEYTLSILKLTFRTYLIVDLIWVLSGLSSEKTIKTMIFHHLICLTGINLFGSLNAEFNSIINMTLLFEINSWMRFIRSYFQENIITDLLFLISWFGLRIILAIYLLQILIIKCIADPNINNMFICFCGICLMGLNIRWTIIIIKLAKKKFL